MARESIVRTALGANAVDLQSGRCIRLRGGDVCAACEQVCPVGLRPWDTELRESEEWGSCTSCGACASVCPTDALALSDAAWRRTHAAVTAWSSPRELSDSLSLTIACSRASDGSEDISIRCLAAFDLPLVLHAWALGASRVCFVDGPCVDCASQAQDTGRAASQAAAANRLAMEMDIPATAMVLPTPAITSSAEEGEHLDRRGFFTWARSRGLAVLAAAAEDRLPPETDIDGETGAGVPSSRRRISVAAMRSLLGRAAIAPSVDRGPLAVSVPTVDAEECVGCGDCALFCPVGALRMLDEDDRRLLELVPEVCVGCGLCERLCRFGAIVMADPDLAVLSAGLTVVVDQPLARCTKCGSRFIRTGDGSDVLCPTCEKSANRYQGFY